MYVNVVEVEINCTYRRVCVLIFALFNQFLIAQSLA